MPLKLLVAYSAVSTHVQTTKDYLSALGHHTGFDVSYVHVTDGAGINFDFNDYDLVFNSYCARHCFEDYVSASYRDALKRFRGLKIIAVQDEYNRTNVLKAAIKELGFHVVLTCVPQDSLNYVYPRYEFPEVEFVTVLAGYVPDRPSTATACRIPLNRRPIVVGYRGRKLDAFYGRLAFEKYEIGRRMKEFCMARGIPHDIAMSEEQRIYGEDWFKFIGSCRTMLGSESGSNVFDFDGTIEARFREFSWRRRAVSYEAFLPQVADREAKISMAQISPRVFECAALHTPVVLFRGRYSNILQPDAHYIPLEKDFSNVDEVFGRIDDIPALERMADRAHQHLVQSGKFGYAAFGRLVRDVVLRKYGELKRSSRSPLPGGTAKRDMSFGILNEIRREIPTPAPLEMNRCDLLRRYAFATVMEKRLMSLAEMADLEAVFYAAEIDKAAGLVDSEAARDEASDECIRRRDALDEVIQRFETAVLRCRIERAHLFSEWRTLCADLFPGATTETAALWPPEKANKSDKFLNAALAELLAHVAAIRHAGFAAFTSICIAMPTAAAPGAQALRLRVLLLRQYCWHTLVRCRRRLAGWMVPLACFRLSIFARTRMPRRLKNVLLRIPWSARLVSSIVGKFG